MNDHLGFPDGVVHGSTTCLTNTLPAFDPARVHASLAIFRPYHPAAERLEELGVSVRFFNRSKWDPRALLDLLKLMREWDIDLLHVNGKKAHFLGRLTASDIAGVPSAHPKAFGYTGLEAMCAGRPLVASRVGGLVEMLGEGERGVLVRPDDPDELAAGILWMIEHPDEANRLAEERRRFASSLTVDRHVNQLMDVCDEIREERAAPAVR